MTRLLVDPRRAPLLVGVAVALVVALGAPMRATSLTRTTADEPHYLITAISLWEDHDLDIGDERGALRYRPFHEVLLPVQAAVSRDGTQVAPHDPLLPLLLAAPTGLGGWLAAKLTLAALAGVLAGLVVVVARHRFGVRPTVAAVAALVAGASPPLAIYGTQVYPELPAALVTLAGFWWATAAPSRRSALGASLAVVALPWLSVKYAPVAAVLAVGLLARLVGGRGRIGRRQAGVVVGGLALAGVAFGVGHQALFGGWTPYAAGSHFTDGEFTVVGGSPDYLGRSWRIVRLLVDRDFGLAVWQPAVVAMVPALAALLRRRPPGTGLLVALVAAGWFTATFVALTMHGWWWPGRQTVVVLPLVVVAIAWWADRLGTRALRVLAAAGVAGVAAYGCLLIGVLGHRHSLIVDFSRTIDPLVHLVGPITPDGMRADGRAQVLSALWAVGLAAWAVLAWRRAGRPQPPMPRDPAVATDPAPAVVATR